MKLFLYRVRFILLCSDSALVDSLNQAGACPQTVLFEALLVDYWASEFTTILPSQGIRILGSEGFWAGVTCPVTRLTVQVTAGKSSPITSDR